MPVRMAEEPASDPGEPRLAVGKAQLLRHYVRGRRVVQRGVERVDILRQAKVAARDAGGQRGGVPNHQQVASRVRGDRRQQKLAEVVVDRAIREREIIRELLFELRE